MTSRPKAFVAWSSGKDAAWALHISRQTATLDIVGIMTTVTEDFERVSMHAVREELLDEQAARLGLPVLKAKIPANCTNEEYSECMFVATDAMQAQGVSHVIFGDLFLQDVRAYREKQMTRAHMSCDFPLWGADTRKLSRVLVESGLKAVLTCVDPKVLDSSFAGRAYDSSLLDDLPDHVDPCGENGEFHTFVFDGPMFNSPIDFERGDIVERDGFIFADILSVATTAADVEPEVLGRVV